MTTITATVKISHGSHEPEYITKQFAYGDGMGGSARGYMQALENWAARQGVDAKLVAITIA